MSGPCVCPMMKGTNMKNRGKKEIRPRRILQFKISLIDIEPKIWRRFLVPDDIDFERFHNIIQIIMGWENYHLFSFENKFCLIDTDKDGFAVDFMWPALKQRKQTFIAETVFLNNIFTTPRQKMIYTYDFGDTWEHEIVLEKILDRDKEQSLPNCLNGEGNCPPEDCGGVPGYYDFIEIMRNNKHPEHKRMVEWYGEVYNPDYFSLDEVNAVFVSRN